MTQRESWLTRITEVKEEGRIPIIAEIKPSTPTAGDLLRGRCAEEIAEAYIAGGAACISVVTGSWFGGDISLLAEVARLTSLPLLRKDLIISKGQIIQTREYGANAVLLTRKLLDATTLKKMIDLCMSFEITPFVEISNIEELSGFQPCNQCIIGISNRDIIQKETDIQSGLKSINMITAAQALSAGALISASGISSPDQANFLYRAGFDGLLIGTELLKASNPRKALIKMSKKGDQQ